MGYIIYKVTNTINGRYYIGRHATPNIDDGYMGSGKAIINAIKKYGKEAFVKEILAEAPTASDLWELEKFIIDHSVVCDPMSYNMAYGGKHYLDGLKKHDYDSFIKHQSSAGKLGGISCYHNTKSAEDRKRWHSNGGKATALKMKGRTDHPFYNGTAASLGGKALKGVVELWKPTAKATNKNQKEYCKGDCKRVNPNTEMYHTLINDGWTPISQHKVR